MADDKISFKCGRCGSAEFKIPSNPKPHDTVECAKCGATTRYDRLQTEAVKLAKAHVQKILKGFGAKIR